MSQADHAYTTPEQFFWNGYRSAEQAIETHPEPIAELKRDALVEKTARLSEKVWEHWHPTLGEVKLLAELAAYWTEGEIGPNGNPCLVNLKSKILNERAVAELIAAVLAYVRNQEGGQ